MVLSGNHSFCMFFFFCHICIIYTYDIIYIYIYISIYTVYIYNIGVSCDFLFNQSNDFRIWEYSEMWTLAADVGWSWPIFLTPPGSTRATTRRPPRAPAIAPVEPVNRPGPPLILPMREWLLSVRCDKCDNSSLILTSCTSWLVEFNGIFPRLFSGLL